MAIHQLNAKLIFGNFLKNYSRQHFCGAILSLFLMVNSCSGTRGQVEKIEIL